MVFIDNTENPATRVTVPDSMVWKLMDLWFQWIEPTEEALARRTFVRQVLDDWVCLEHCMTQRLNERWGYQFYSIFAQEDAQEAWRRIVEQNQNENDSRNRG